MPSHQYEALVAAWMKVERARAGLPPEEELGSPDALADHIAIAEKAAIG